MSRETRLVIVGMWLTIVLSIVAWIAFGIASGDRLSRDAAEVPAGYTAPLHPSTAETP